MSGEYNNGKTNNYLQEIKYAPVPVDQPNSTKNEDRKPDSWFLYFTLFTGMMTWIVGGTSIVWPSSAIVKLNSNDTNINPIGRPITTTEISLLLGASQVFSIMGTILLPKFADFIGRKYCLLFMGLGMLLSYIGLAFSHSIELICIFYSLVVTIFSALMGVFPIYLSEICEDHNRTKFGCLVSAALPLGQLFTYSVGPLLNMKYYTLLLSTPLIPFLILFLFVPESPAYLLRRKREKETVKALQKLRNYKSSKELKTDLEKIRETLTVEKTKVNVFDLFRTKEGRVGIMICLIALLTQFASGIPVLMPLLSPIFNESGSNFSGDTIAIFVGFVKLISFSLTFFVVEKAGRKPLLVISAIGAGVSMASLSIFFYLNQIKSPLIENLQWVPLVSCLSYFTFYGIGLGPIPSTMVSVLFTVELKSDATSFILTIVNSVIALYVTIYPPLAELIGIHWCMCIFSISCFIGGFLIYIKVPETKGKSMNQIQQILKDY